MHLFITGTDTNVGKTFFTRWLVRTWRTLGYSAAGLKPIATGDLADAEELASASALTPAEVNFAHFPLPAAPLIAARAAGRAIDFPTMQSWIENYEKRFPYLAIEGVGGWRVPLAPGYEVFDWARELGLPVVVVARAGLGTLNHSLLTVDSIRACGLTCAGLVLNHGAEPPNPDLARSNAEVLSELLALPVFDFDGAAHRAGKVPVWLGGKEI